RLPPHPVWLCGGCPQFLWITVWTTPIRRYQRAYL
ncbi:MAG: hypothetical protein ACI9PX_000157, partial [Reinekea sp.]